MRRFDFKAVVNVLGGDDCEIDTINNRTKKPLFSAILEHLQYSKNE